MLASAIPGQAVKAEYMAEFYVSVSGDDSADGSLEKPFKTIERAKQAVRKINKNMTSDIMVYIREGVY